VLLVHIFLIPEAISNDPVYVAKLIFLFYTCDEFQYIAGSFWFISSIMWMYIFAPIFAAAIRRIKDNVASCRILFVVILTAGYVLKLTSELYGLGLYPTPFGHIDEFFCAFLLSYIGIGRIESNKVLKALLVIGVISCVLVPGGIYVALFPTLVFIIAFDSNVRSKNEKLSMDAVKRNKWRAAEAFSVMSFSFYLWHQVVINIVCPMYFTIQTTFATNLHVMLIAFPVTCLFATAWYLSVERTMKKIGSRYGLRRPE